MCNVPVYPQVETVVGSSVELPCNTSSPTDDSVQLILWFKSAYGTGPPFLKLDARSSNSLETASITLASEYENRIYFNLSSSPSILNINPVREEDASIYSCRVDYKWSRTSISNINLFIIGKLTKLESIIFLLHHPTYHATEPFFSRSFFFLLLIKSNSTC